MSAINIPEISARFIPYDTFDGDFISPLNELVKQHKITHTEKVVMQVLNGFCFKNGETYPRIETIAKKADISPRQTKNIIKSLEQKGFIEVVRPSLIDRKLFKATNEYFFLFHIEYYQFFELPEREAQEQEQKQPENSASAPDITSDIAPDAPIYKKSKSQNSIKNPVSGFLSPKEKNIMPELNEVARQINDKNQGSSKKRFNPVQAIGSAIKNNIHPEAIYEALQAVNNAWDILQTPWGYFNNIIQIKNGNYNERDHIRASKQMQAEIENNQVLLDLARGIG